MTKLQKLSEKKETLYDYFAILQKIRQRKALHNKKKA